jgi:putative FmdB family regulatory protein
MPVYDYLCTACDHRADIIHGINDPAPNFCPSCGAEGTMRKQFSAPSIHFKGSGWAKKDRGGGSSGAKAAPSKAAEPKGEQPAPSSDTGDSSSSASSSTSSSDSKA